MVGDHEPVEGPRELDRDTGRGDDLLAARKPVSVFGTKPTAERTGIERVAGSGSITLGMSAGSTIVAPCTLRISIAWAITILPSSDSLFWNRSVPGT